MRKYGIFGNIWLALSLIYTKLFFRQARLIRLPFDIRNSNNIRIGKGFTCGFACRLECHPVVQTKKICLFLGENIQINDFVHIAAGESVTVGNNVLIASKVFISDINHGTYTGKLQDSPVIPPSKRPLSTNPVNIEENVWIGESVCILPGVTIGRGSIIGSSAVVTKDIPPYSIAVGSPAKAIKKFNFDLQQWSTIN